MQFLEVPFCLSLGDFWDIQVADEWRTEALDVIRGCQSLDWLILTKRPQNIRKMLPPDWGEGWPHVWLGVTTESMVEARRRIPVLLRVPARVHWLRLRWSVQKLAVPDIPCTLKRLLDAGIHYSLPRRSERSSGAASMSTRLRTAG
jgi:protein gp37